MNKKMIFSTLGKLTISEAILMIFPLIVALIYKEWQSAIAFLISIGIATVIGLALYLIFKTSNQVIYAKEGFIIVAFGWLIMSVIGAVPFVINADIPNYIDAFFETVSGFTTTGATILTDVETLSKGGLFWRSFTHWVGGMGVLVFVMAVLPSVSDRSIHIMRAEMPGPIVGKIVPRARETARILYIIYFAMTVVETVLLLAGGMPLFDSVVHAFGTAGTGGFGIRNSSIASYSPYLQWVITIFMFLFGINFNLYYLIFIRKGKSVIKSGELWAYIAIICVAIAVIFYDSHSMFNSLEEAFRASAFQVSSFITSTGFATIDHNILPTLSKAILIVLMFIGACAGSTGGGFKVARIVMLVKMVKQELRRIIHPRAVTAVKFEGKVVDQVTLSSVSSYLAIYLLFFIGTFLLMSTSPYTFETDFTATLSCINNIGPLFSRPDSLVGFGDYSYPLKIVLSFAMLFGRLEIYPLLIALSPSTWTKK